MEDSFETSSDRTATAPCFRSRGSPRCQRINYTCLAIEAANLVRTRRWTCCSDSSFRRHTPYNQGLNSRARRMAMKAGISPLLAAARDYLRKGLLPLPIPPGGEAPRVKGWQNLRLSENDLASHFQNGSNIGILLGGPCGSLVDV